MALFQRPVKGWFGMCSALLRSHPLLPLPPGPWRGSVLPLGEGKLPRPSSTAFLGPRAGPGFRRAVPRSLSPRARRKAPRRHPFGTDGGSLLGAAGPSLWGKRAWAVLAAGATDYKLYRNT